MTDVEVWVSEKGEDVFAGMLYTQRRRSTESATFIYDERFVAREDAYALDPALPLTLGPHHTPTDLALFNAFGDTSPDRWGRTLVKRAERIRARENREAPRSLSELDYLLGARDDLRQGALRFKLSGGPFLAVDDLGVPAVNDLGELVVAASGVENDTAGKEEVQRMLRAGSSLGGIRPKSHVLAPGGRVAIAKFPSSRSDTWNVMAWEQVALDLAGAAGIEIPDAQLVEIGSRQILIVARFDRSGDGYRIGYCSALTMLEARDGQQRSYLDIAAKIEEISPRATKELQQLWRRIAFSILISNTDDHLRNHGFLHTAGGSWRLAPAFDMNPNPEPGTKYLSNAIDDVDSRASISLLLEVTPYFRLDDEGGARILREVHEAVNTWRGVAASQGLAKHEIEEMEPAFEHSEQEQAAAAVA